MRALRGLLALFVVAVACGDEAGPATEIVVYVDADDAVRGRATNIEVVVSGRAADGTEFTLAEGGLIDIPPGELPFQFSFAPVGGDTSRQWEVAVRGEEGATVFIEKIARGVYVPDQSRVLYMVLRNDCADELSCPADQTCDAGGCTTSIRTPDTLPVYAGGRVPPPDMPDPPVCETNMDCADGMFCNGPETCDPDSPEADAEGCVAGDPPCAMGDACDEGADSCMMGGCEDPDADGDGFDRPECSGGMDCNDEDATINPDAAEIDDGMDNDCDGMVDEGFECVSGPETNAATCSDGCDNDEDGRTDCEDDGCPRGEACYCDSSPRVERSDEACSDGCDNDHNGFTDCADWHCDGYAGCTGTNRSCDNCVSGQACLARRPYGFTSGGRPTCGRPCDITRDVDTDMPGFQPDCPSGEFCWWRGQPASTDGVCAPGNMGAPPPPNVGDACSSDSACASPKGWGRCLNAEDEGFPGGYCTVLDCAAPGGPPSPGLCGTDGQCVRLDNTSYCFERCLPVGDACRAGYRCVTEVEGGVCLPDCSSGSSTCGSFGTCVDGRYCLPSSGF